MKNKKLTINKLLSLSLSFVFILAFVTATSAQKRLDKTNPRVIEKIVDNSLDKEAPDTKYGVFFEGFDNGDMIPSGWLNIDNDGDGWGWDFYWDSEVDSYSDEGVDNWLISPEIRLTPDSDSKMFLSYYTGGEVDFSIYVSTSGRTIADFKATKSLFFNDTLAGSEVLVLDLDAYKGKNIYLAFVQNYNEDISTGWGIALNYVEIRPLPELTDILAMNVAGLLSVEINKDNHTIVGMLANGTNWSNLTPSFSIPHGSTLVTPGDTLNQDFSDGTGGANTLLTYKVYAADSAEDANWDDAPFQAWTVDLDTAGPTPPSSATDILAFDLGEATYWYTSGYFGTDVYYWTSELADDADIDDVAHTITCYVPNGTDVTAFASNFELSSGATASIGVVNQVSMTDMEDISWFWDEDDGYAYIEDADGMPTLNNYTSAVTIKVTAQDGTTTQNWVVTVIEIVPSAENAIIGFNTIEWYNEVDDFWVDATPEEDNFVINATNKTIAIALQYEVTKTDSSDLKTYFVLSDNAMISPTNGQIHMTDKDSKYVYEVSAEDGTKANWTVTYSIEAPSNATLLTDVHWANREGDLTFDDFANRYYGTTYYGTSLIFAPTFEVSHGAITIPENGSYIDFSNGPVVITVIAEDRTTREDYTIFIENGMPSDDANIWDFWFNNAGIDDIDIDEDEATIEIYVPIDVNISNLDADADIHPMSTISPNPENVVNYTSPVEFTVTAQNGTVKVWTVYVMFTDNIKPIARTDVQTVATYEDSVYVKSSELGHVFIFHEELFMDEYLGEDINWFGDFDDLEDLVDDGYLDPNAFAYAEVNAVNAKTYIRTDNLNPGKYFAYAYDRSFNLSDRAENYVMLVVQDTMEVATLEELRMGNKAFVYNFTGEAVITFMQDFNNQMYIQDETAAILVNDPAGVITTTYALGDAISGFYGVLGMSNNMLEFIPSSNPGAAVSTANVVTPMVISMEEMWDDDNEFDFFAHQAMLVQFNNIMFDGYEGIFQQNRSYDFMSVGGGFELFTNFNKVDYLTTATTIPTNVVNVVGLMNTDIEGNPVFTPRKAADMTSVEGIEIYKEDMDFGIVYVGDSAEMTSAWGNIGNGSLVVNSVAFVGNSLFTFTDENTYPLTLPSFTSLEVMVEFEPDSSKMEEAMIVITYDTDKKDTIMVMAEGVNLPIWTVGTLEDFEEGYEDGDMPAGFSEIEFSPYIGSGYGWSVWEEDDFDYDPDPEVETDFCMAADYGIQALRLPQIDLSGEDVAFPALQYFHGTWYGNIEDAYVAVSLDPNADWEDWDKYQLDVTKIPSGGAHAKVIIPLYDYVGEEEVWVAIYAERLSGFWLYYYIDNLEIVEVPNVPVVVANEKLNYNTTAVGESEVLTVDIKNEGASFVSIDDVYIMGDAAKVSEFKLESADSVNYDVFENYESSVLSFKVMFEPTTAGLKQDTIVIMYSDAISTGLMKKVALVGYGTSCAGAATALLGENEAPGAPMWYTYTPAKDMVITIESTSASDPDTKLLIFNTCDLDDFETPGTEELAYMDDAGNSYLHFFAAEGVEYKIYWSGEFDTNPFTWTLEIDTTPGEVCQMAIPVTLPLTNFTGTTENVDDYYEATPCYDYYISGNDIVYTFTLEEASFISGSIEGDYVGMHVVRGNLPLPYDRIQTAPACAGFAADGLSVITFNNRFAPAGIYNIIVSTWAQPQFSAFTLNLSATEAHREATIMEIQGTVEFTPFEDTYVITTGIVTAVYNNGYYIQDGAGAWNGIQVYDPDNFESVAVGDELRIDGKAKEYYSMTNIEDIVTTEVVSSDNELPAVSEIDVDEVGEPWEGVLVTIGDVVVAEGFNQYNEFIVEDEQGNQVMIDGTIYHPEEVYVGATYTITGIVNYSYNTWRIRPRGEEDVVTGVEDVTSNISFNVYPNPSNGIFTVTVNSNQMNDLTIELVNVQGEVIYTQRAEDVTTFTGDVDVTEFAKGVYYLRVFNGEEVKVEKVIVQ